MHVLVNLLMYNVPKYGVPNPIIHHYFDAHVRVSKYQLMITLCIQVNLNITSVCISVSVPAETDSCSACMWHAS